MICIILLLSPISKYLIEKYDYQTIGRQITLNGVSVNPFTGNVNFNRLKIYEFNSDSLFISANSVDIHLTMHKLLSNTFEISGITLKQPNIMVDKKSKEFNFTDIIKKLTPEKINAKPSNLHVNILGIKIQDGIIHYRDKSIPVNYFIKNVNIECPGKRWNSDSLDVKYSFSSGTLKGNMKGNFAMNVRSLSYKLDVIVHGFDLRILEPYVNELKNYGSFSAYLEANLKAKGNFKDANDVTFKGMLAVNKFHFGKNPQVDYGSFDKIQLAIYQLSPKEHKYLFDSVSLTLPHFKYEVYDHSDNIQEMFGKNGSNHQKTGGSGANFNLLKTIGDYIAVLSKNFFHSDYKINRLALYNGSIIYNDYTLSEKFALRVEPITIISDSIDKSQDRVNLKLKSSIKPSGDINISLSINPKDSGDFDLNYHLQRIPATLFNPFLITHTSYPLNRGIVELNGVWNVRNGFIKSKNHLEIIDPRTAKRVDNHNTKWLPMWLVLAIVRDRGNVIDYQVPITGNLKSPTLHLKDVVLNALENIIVKPVTTPYRIRVKNTEEDIQKSLSMNWEMKQSELESNQKKFIDGMVDFLSKNPEASIVVHPQLFAVKEKEFILLFEAKKKYYLAVNHKNNQTFNKDDSILIDKMSIRDGSFTHYLNKKTEGNLFFTIQEKCAFLLGNKFINSKFAHLNREREYNFRINFVKKGVEKQIKFAPPLYLIPFNGYSFFKITYNGQLPEKLVAAYCQMNDLNNRVPRKEYKLERKKVRSSHFRSQLK